jgi:hypothetical protein
MIAWLLIIVAGIVIVAILFGDGEARLCPSCGTQLGEALGRPGEPAKFCTRCGWDER